MRPNFTAPLSRRGIPSRLALVTTLIALWLPCSAAHAAGHAGGGVGPPSPRGHGPLFPLLPDGTPIEPSTYREESTESADVLDEGRWEWDVDLVGSSLDWVASMRASSIECLHAELRRGLGGGLEAAARAESWNRGTIDQGALQGIQENGYGPTTLSVRQQFLASHASGPSACAGFRLRLPGSAEGPGTHTIEGGFFVPAAVHLSETTRLGMMFEGDLVADALDAARHIEGVSSLELSHDFAERLSARCEAVSVWYGENARPWLGVVDASISLDPAPHVGLTLGVSGGLSGGTTDLGCFGRFGVHP